VATAAKTAAVAEIRDAFANSSAAVLTEYRGLTVAQIKDLRRTLAGNATYAVVKNTLTKIAARDAGIPGLEGLLEGPSAIAFVNGDPVTVAKGIRDFSRANPFLVIKGGVLDGRPLSADEIRRLADLESREVLLARLAGGMQASLAAAVALIAAPLSQAARVLAALQALAEEDPSVLRGGAGTPAADATPAAVEAGGAESAPATEELPPAPAAPAGLGAEPPVGQPTAEDAEEPAATSGDAADAAVVADALAQEVVPAEQAPQEQAPQEQAPQEQAPQEQAPEEPAQAGLPVEQPPTPQPATPPAPEPPG
jgi:large subunit ribosomal protein L10